jgi:hypothetical protein
MAPRIDDPIAVPGRDLAALTRSLSKRFAHHPPMEHVPGKTAIRDAVVDIAGCSEAEAERLVDQLERQGFVRYGGDPTRIEQERHAWVFAAEPQRAH